MLRFNTSRLCVFAFYLSGSLVFIGCWVLGVSGLFLSNFIPYSFQLYSLTNLILSNSTPFRLLKLIFSSFFHFSQNGALNRCVLDESLKQGVIYGGPF